MFALTILYVMTALFLAVYAFNAYILTLITLYFEWQRNGATPLPIKSPLTDAEEKLPKITVQLPIFNEALVVNRLLEAISRLDYPHELLQIQVLDDSTDETTEIAAVAVKRYQQLGFNITLLHRRDRVGFKAGALAAGLTQATGEFIAMFDADFVPPPDFLWQTLPPLLTQPQVGFVQTRWGHLNRNYSGLTAAQGLAIDGHFTIEQTARYKSGYLLNFNGTAGIWRRSCIDSSGGWQGDTLCEDMDLSYRAQLIGWQPVYLRDIISPAELPPQLAAFKRQQFRWAKGSIQCLKKLGQPVILSPRYSWFTKLQALIHLSNYLVHPLMVILTLLTPMLIYYNSMEQIRFPLIYLSLGSFGPPFMYLVTQIILYPKTWRQHYKIMPLLALLGGGIALSNSKAIMEGLLGVGNNFRRTPKFNVASAQDKWQDSVYRLPLDGLVIGEVALSLYSFWGAWLAATNGHGVAVPFILLYALSFGYVGAQGVWEARYDLRFWLNKFPAPPLDPDHDAPRNIRTTI